VRRYCAVGHYRVAHALMATEDATCEPTGDADGVVDVRVLIRRGAQFCLRFDATGSMIATSCGAVRSGTEQERSRASAAR